MPILFRILSVSGFILFVSIGWLKAQPGPYPSGTKINYVRTWEATAPEQNPASLVNRPVKDVKQTTAYFDGLGRPLQTVVKQGSMVTGSSPVDLVNPVVYDAFGRVEFRYLPFASNNTGSYPVNDGNFKLNPFQQQAVFAAAQYPGESYYYSRTQFESSPLNRIEKTLAPGNSWVGNNKGADKKYLINTTLDDVRIWNVTDNPGQLSNYSTSGAYPAGSLFKEMTINEEGHQNIEFKDKNGKVVLQKIQIGSISDNGTGTGYDGFLCTYYIYDDLNNLRCVIQPKGVDLIKTNWTLTATILNEQCFRYEFDTRKRIIIKKIPGASEVYLVYDTRDRLVFSQDGNKRSSQQWLTLLYDQLNRQVLKGLINYSGSRQQLQELVSIQTSTSGTTSIAADLTLNTLTNSGTYYATNSITLDAGFESATNSDITAELINSGGSPDAVTMIEGVPVSLNPLPSGTTPDPLEISYYDNYQWAATLNTNLKDFTTSSVNTYLQAASDNNYPYAQAVVKSDAVTNLKTGTKKRVLGITPAQFITEINFYDDENRLIQTRSQNITGSYDATTWQYSWAGKTLVSVQQQQKAAPNVNAHSIVSDSVYDDFGRLASVSKRVFSQINGINISKPQQEIARYEYDAIGNIKRKILGNDVEQMDYDLNIRGWILGVNRNFIKDANQRYFGFELGYDKASTILNGSNFVNTRIDGNVSGTVWKSAGDNEKRKLDYTYDGASRLTSADFNQYTGGTFNKSSGLNFSVGNLSYDANGNILSMQQYGWKPGQSSAMIDNLQYNYYDQSNRLKNVLDANNDADTKLGDFRSSKMYMTSLNNVKTNSATDYSYDANGNLIRDLNKDIGSATEDGIVFNFLNLPQIITFRNSSGVKGTIYYFYDATGNKLKKVVAETNGPSTTTLYMNGVVYKNDTLQFIGNDDGRLRYGKHYFANGDSAWEYNYDYFIKDHLNDIRMVLTEQKDTAKYAATMETTFRTKEEALFSNISSTAFPTPSYYPTDVNVTNPNNHVAQLNGTTGKKVGPSIILKVMGGDQVDLFVKSFYQANTKGNNNLPVEEIVSGLAESLIGSFGEAKGTLAQLTDVSGPITGGLSLFRSQKQNDYPDKPKAYLNWILFDEQFNYVSNSSGASGVTTSGVLQSHVPATVSISKNGYFYIYTSNETENWNVFFNDLIIEHRAGKISEETHYYPFGLTMAGISSTAEVNRKPENKMKFQGQELANKEFSDGSGLEMYEFRYRMHDPQTGRFWHLDPLAEKYYHNAPYAFSENKVTGHIELEGLESIESTNQKSPLLRAAVRESVQRPVDEVNKSAAKMATLKLTIGIGVGFKMQAGRNGVDASIHGPQASTTFNLFTDKWSADASAAGGGISMATPGRDSQLGFNSGNHSIDENGKTSSNFFQVGAESTITESQQNVTGNEKGELSISGKLGVVGAELTVNPKETGNAFSKLAEVVKNYLSELWKETHIDKVGGYIDTKEKEKQSRR